MISTRQNKILDEFNNQIYALIPVLDMCNHEEGEICTDYDVELSTANCYAMKNLSIGDEVRKKRKNSFCIKNK